VVAEQVVDAEAAAVKAVVNADCDVAVAVTE